jgi:hypothetical protein
VVLADGRVAGVVTSSAAVETFLRLTGSLPQNMNWAVRSDMLMSLTNWQAEPDVQNPVTDKMTAVDRVVRAVVRIVSE